MKTYAPRILLLLPVLFLLTACGAKPAATPEETASGSTLMQVTLYELSSEALSPTLSLEGRVEAMTSVEVKTKEAGMVEGLAVKVGDQVKEGDILATLSQRPEDNSVTTQYQTLQTSMNTLRASLASTLEVQDQSILQAELSVKNADIALGRARTQLRELEATTKQDIASAQTALANALTNSSLGTEVAETSVERAEQAIRDLEVTNEKNLEDAIALAMVTLRAQEIQAETILYTVDTLLGIDPQNKTANDSYEKYLGVLDRQLLIDTEFLYKKLREDLRTYKSEKGNSTPEDQLLQFQVYLVDLERLVNNTDGLFRASITAGDFLPSSLDRLKAQITPYLVGGGSVSTMRQTLTRDIQGIQNVQIRNEQSLDNAELALDAAKKNVKNAKQEGTSGESAQVLSRREDLRTVELRSKTQLSSARTAIETQEILKQNAETALLNARKGKDVQRLSFERQLKDLEGQQTLLKTRIQNLVVRAPFAGTVTQTFVEVGSSVGNGSPVLTLSQVENKKLIVALSEEEYVRVDSSVLTREDTDFTLYTSSPVLDPKTRKYTLEYIIPTGYTTAVGSWMTVMIPYKLAPGSIFLPIRLLKVRDASKVVLTLTADNHVQETPVVTGTVYGEYIEILSGLSLDDRLIDTAPPELLVGQPVEVTSL